MSTLLRIKRKACAEPVEGLVLALKRSKSDAASNSDEVVFKFAATLESETESVKDHIQAVLLKDRATKSTQWRDPRKQTIVKKNVQNICERIKKENKVISEKKRLDLLNNRRLIFTETLPIDKEGESCEVRKLFHLYDIIEENEEVKKSSSEEESCTGNSPIMCNGEVMIREKADQYVYDVYIAENEITSFVDQLVGIRPCAITVEDLYSDNSNDSEENAEDEDDSNDENNWRNDYPEEEDSASDEETRHSDECDASNKRDSDEYDPFYPSGKSSLEKLRIYDDEEEYGSEDSYSYRYSTEYDYKNC